MPTGGTCTSGANGSGASIQDAIISGQIDAFDDAAMVWVNNVQVGGSLSQTGNTVNFAAQSIAGLTTQYQYYIASNSGTARSFLTLTNPTGSPITVPVTWATNSGADSGTVIKGTSSGDTIFTTADRWVVSDESADSGGDPAITSVLYGPGSPAVTPTSVSTTVFSCAGTEGVLANYSVTIPAGQTRALLWFNQINTTTTNALANAPAFFNTNPATGGDLLSGLTTTQLSQVVNWNFAPCATVTFDGVSPTTTGGRLLATDWNFTQSGIWVEAFDAANTGTLSGTFFSGHFHIGPDGVLPTNSELQHFNISNELQGFFVELAGGGPFDLVGLDYRIRGTTSINGFSSSDIKILLSTTFNPVLSVASQFTQFSAGTGVQVSPQHLNVTGFTGVTRVFIASSADVSFDNIMVNCAAPTAADFDDAPASYGTASHTATGPQLGAARDTESGTFDTANANGDDLNNTDDEDGVTFGTLVRGSMGSATVNVSGPARLDAWIDFNGNGVFGDVANELITAAGGTALAAAGNHTLNFAVPTSATLSPTFARFRLSTSGGLAPSSAAADGEVEDYLLSLQNAPPVAEANGPYSVPEGGSVGLSSAGSFDPDGSIVAFQWDLDNDGNFGETGAGALRGNETGPSPTFSAVGLDGPSSHPVFLRVVDNNSAVSLVDSATVNVTNVAPSGLSLSLSPASINENQSTTLLGSFTDPGTPDVHQVDVDWNGDGTFDQTVTLPTGNRAFSIASPTYLDDGPSPGNGSTFDVTMIRVQVRDDDGGSTPVGTTNLTVNNVAPSGLSVSVSPSSINENQLTTLLGSFSDPGTLDVHQVDIDWDGNGSFDQTVTLPTGNRAFTIASPTYLDDGPSPGNCTPFDVYTLRVRVRDDDSGTSSTATTNLTVNNVAPTITSLMVDDNDINEGDPPITLSGTYTDPGTLDVHTLTIDWGDGTAPQTFAVSGGSFSFQHQYWDDNPTNTAVDINTISVTLSDDDEGDDSDSVNITVRNVAPTVSNYTFGPDIDTIDNNGVIDADDPAINGWPTYRPTGLRLHPILFRVTFTDPSWHVANTSTLFPSGVPNRDSFTFQYDWDGNGTFDESVTGVPTLTAPNTLTFDTSHFYELAGFYTPKVRVRDDDTGVSNTFTLADGTIKIENVGAAVIDGNLVVAGTTSNDVIRVNTSNPAAVTVKFGSATVRNPAGGYSFNVSGRVIVYGWKGNDQIYVDGTGTLPTELLGQDGNDLLSGGFGNDVLRGGAGNDTAMGGGGNDVLVGGLGRDVLKGGTDHDMLISGENSSGYKTLRTWGNHWAAGTLSPLEILAILLTTTDPAASNTTDYSNFDELYGDAGNDFFVLRRLFNPVPDILHDFGNGADQDNELP